MTKPLSLEDGLSMVLSHDLGTTVTVGDLSALGGGSSRSLWEFRATWNGAEKTLVLCRRDPGGNAAQAVRSEAAAIKAAALAQVPVPKVYSVFPGDEPLGGPCLIMEKVDGETLPRRILDSPRLEVARGGLATQCGRALGRIHRIDPAALTGLPDSDRLSEYRLELDRVDRGRPALELGYRYLVEDRPRGLAQVLVHGDFRLGNLVVDDQGLRAVLDWESCHRGDPLEDLGWIAIKAWRFRGDGEVGGFGSITDFLAGYEVETGLAIEPETFRWALILNTWIWGVGTLMQANRHLSASRRSPDLAVVGRRLPEIERDLLEILP